MAIKHLWIYTLLSLFLLAGCGPKNTPMDSAEGGKNGECSLAIDCDDGNICTDDDCVNQVCVYTNNTAPCNDGDPCTMDDACTAGTCSGDPLDADNDSHVSNACGGNDCNDGNPAVNPGASEGPNGNPTCADTLDNDCDGDVDDADAGCAPEPECTQPSHCDDGNVCTDDDCVNQVCVYTNNTAPCNDGDPCTMDDACTAGTCSGDPLDADNDGHVSNACGGNDCDDGNPAVNPGASEGPHGNPTCADTLDNDCDGDVDDGDAGCAPEPECTQPSHCDDGNVCTDDDCVDQVCVYTNNTAPCNDGDPCTMDDSCAAGTCSGDPLDSDHDGHVSNACGGNDCDDGNPAVNPGASEGPHGNPTCADTLDNDCDGDVDDADAGCEPEPECTQPSHCDDGDVCTDDDCVDQVCVYTNNTAPCNDSDPCTMDDACAAGTCSGDPLDADNDGHVSDACGGNDCDDGNPAVNPGASEGPDGNPTCADTLDNDCDGDVDDADAGCASTNALIGDHNSVLAFDSIPAFYINEAKALFRIAYGHTSHGSQILTGMSCLRADFPLYDYNESGAGGALSIHESALIGTLGNPDRVTWAQRTRDLLNTPGNDRNFIMWAWCGEVSSAYEADINTYLSLMDELEEDFPDVIFVYMTGHLDGTGETRNLNIRNNQIRDYCQTNNKVLFDFADIESYDPDGNYFLDQRADDQCDYDGGNWADEWCDANPGSILCRDCSCAHSRSLNCNMKGRAFWWMLAMLAGWDGN